MKKRYETLLIILLLIGVIFLLKDVDFLEVLALLKEMKVLFLILSISSISVSFLLWNQRWKVTLSVIRKVGYFFLFEGNFELFSEEYVGPEMPMMEIGGFR